MGGRIPRRKSFPLASMLACAAALSLAAAPAHSQRRFRPRANWGRARPGGLKVGTPAPDFELPVLKFERKKDGTVTGRITDRKVQLSSFKGKKAVVLFFSSYT